MLCWGDDDDCGSVAEGLLGMQNVLSSTPDLFSEKDQVRDDVKGFCLKSGHCHLEQTMIAQRFDLG